MISARKIITSLATTALLMTGVTSIASADENNETKEKLENKIYIEGADLNDSQANVTKKNLGVNDSYKKYKITTDDVLRYTGGTYDYIHSSATIEPKKIGKGVDVDIATPDNITRITKEQYTNASITSGVENAKIKVASIDKVTGEGALSGIYKALEEEGIEVDPEDIQKANQEMDDLASINDSQSDNGNNINEPLNNAVADMKEQIANKKINGEDVSRDDVEKVVNITLKAKGLDKVLTDEQKSKIVNIVYNTSQSKAIEKDPKAFKKQASKLKSGLSDSIKKLNSDNNDNNDNNDDDGMLQKIWNNIIEFFKSIINSIIDFFRNLF